jgi:hypothetical protein
LKELRVAENHVEYKLRGLATKGNLYILNFIKSNIVCYLLLCYTLREAELSDIPGIAETTCAGSEVDGAFTT